MRVGGGGGGGGAVHGGGGAAGSPKDDSRCDELSATVTVPRQSTATPRGFVKPPMAPGSEPSEPNQSSFPEWCVATYTVPSASTATPCGSGTRQPPVSLPSASKVSIRQLPASAT